jgi:hypothetical protein
MEKPINGVLCVFLAFKKNTQGNTYLIMREFKGWNTAKIKQFEIAL